MTQGQIMQGLSLGTETILLNFFKKYFKGGNEQELEEFGKEAIKVTQIVIEDLRSSNQSNVEELEKQAIKNVKAEIASRDFVEKQITLVEKQITEVKGAISNLRLITIGIGAFLAILMFVLQPQVFEWITKNIR